MSNFWSSLDELRITTDKHVREIAKDDALAAIDSEDGLTGHENWAEFADYGDWVTDLPQLIKNDKKKAKKHLKALVKLTARKNKIVNEDSAETLLLKIKRCRSIEDLNALEAGELSYHPEHEADGKKTIYRLAIALADRIDYVVKKQKLNDPSVLHAELKQQCEYLEAKQRADKAAWPLTIVLCLLGLGVVCGIAMFVALPAFIGVIGVITATCGVGYLVYTPLCNLIKRLLPAESKKWAAPIAIAISVVVAAAVCALALTVAWPIIGIVGFLSASALIGYVEVPVFFSFIKNSLRNIFVRNVFKAIDNNLLNKLAKEKGLKDRHEFADLEKEKLLNTGSTKWWKRLKYALTGLGGVLSVISTVGFAALTYMQILEVLPLLGITAGIGMIAIPAVFAVLAIPYFLVIFDNIFKAIKNNIFAEIWNGFKSVYYLEGFTKMSASEQGWHVVKCAGKSFFVLLALGIVTFATIFSAGAWLQASVEFFTGPIALGSVIAEKIGMVVGLIQVATNFGFSLENCFITVGKLGAVVTNTGAGIKLYFNHVAEQIEKEPFPPKKAGIAIWSVLRLIIKFVPLMLHITGSGMLSAQGTEAFILKPIENFLLKLFGGNETAAVVFAATTQGASEGIEDSHTLMPDHAHEEDSAHHHHHDEHSDVHKHEHAAPDRDLKWLTKKYDSAVDWVYNKATMFYHRCMGDKVPEEAPKIELEEKFIQIKP